MSTAVDPGELKAEGGAPEQAGLGLDIGAGEECYAAATFTFNGALERRPVLAVSSDAKQDGRGRPAGC